MRSIVLVIVVFQPSSPSQNPMILTYQYPSNQESQKNFALPLPYPISTSIRVTNFP